MTFNLTFQPWLYALLALGVLWASSALILRSSQVRGMRFRVTILLLRLGVLATILAILADPVVRKGIGSGDDTVKALLLVDTSRSMAFGETGKSRLDTVRAALAKHRADIAAKARLLTFDADLGEAPIALDALPQSPSGRSTHLGAALRRAVDAAREVGAPDVVVFSDGRTQDALALGDTVELLRAQGIRVSAMPVGRPPTTPNGAIVNCGVERQAPAGSRVPVRVLVAFQAVHGAEARLALTNAEGDVIDETVFPAAAGLAEKTFTASVGKEDETFGVVLDLLAGEQDEQDNSLDFTIEVVNPTVRVLYMEGSNHKDKRWKDKWEYDFIGEALRETDHIDVDIMTVDEQLAEGGRLFYVDDPGRGFPGTRDGVFAYDVIICSDINRTIFTPDQLAWVVELVAERGGGFCMIGGYTAFGAGKWDRTVWEKMIPVDMQTEDEGYRWEKIKPLIPQAVRSHPIWTIDTDPEANARILEAHPEFLGTNLVNRAKPAATVLAYWEKENMPIICVQRYGKGRSMAFMPDAAGGWGELYQTEWGEGEKDNRYYRRFWVNAVRWLAENSLSSRQTALLAATDAINYRPGDAVVVTARKRKLDKVDDLRPWTVTAELEGVNGRPVRLALQDNGTFRGSLDLPETLAAQEPVVRVTAIGPKQQTEEERVPIRIVQTSVETLDPTPDPGLLRDLATLTGGTVYEPTDDSWAERLITDKAAERAGIRQFDVPLWDRSWIWALLIMLLSFEWFLRKRLRLRGEA